MSKTCHTCKKEKPLTDFAKDKSSKDGYQKKCKACKSEYNKQHYKDNQKKYTANTLARRNEVRKAVNAYKDKPCADCEIWFPYYVMDFDHVRGVKTANVSKLINTTSMVLIRKEIEKCDLVCANCHRIRTHQRKQHLRK